MNKYTLLLLLTTGSVLVMTGLYFHFRAPHWNPQLSDETLDHILRDLDREGDFIG